MTAIEFAGQLLAALLALGVVLLVARVVAGFLRQPAVIVEITAGLALGPVLLPHLDAAGPGGLLSPDVTEALSFIGHVGLVLFIVGVAHDLGRAPGNTIGKDVVWTGLGTLLVPAVTGLLVGWWLVARPDGALRGEAPAAALVLMIATCFAVTAVPVLAGVLSAHRLTGTDLGRLAMATAMTTDVVAWLLLAVSLSLAASALTGLPVLLGLIAGGVLGCLLLRRFLGNWPGQTWIGRHPYVTAGIVAVAAMGVSSSMRSWGLTEVFGALLVGLALPVGERWQRPVQLISRLGRLLVPVFFVVAGLTALSEPWHAMPWLMVALVTVVAVGSKTLGSYAGALLGGRTPRDAMRAAALLNTRGLTELVVLQAGHEAGILTSELYLVLVAMALLSTALAGPFYAFVTRRFPCRQPHRCDATCR